MAEVENKIIVSLGSGRGNTKGINYSVKYNFKAADFYNERAKFLYRNKIEPKRNEKREIRLITQEMYDKILSNERHSTIDGKYILEETVPVLFDLHDNSELMDIKYEDIIEELKDMLKDSNLNSEYYDGKEARRMEQASAFLFDTKKLEIRLDRQDDGDNHETQSAFVNICESELDDSIVYDKIVYNGKGDPDEEIIVFGGIHTHPINFHGEHGARPSSDPLNHANDPKWVNASGLILYQLYPIGTKENGVNEVDAILPKWKDGKLICKNDISTTEELLNGEFDLIRTTLELRKEYNLK